MNMSRIDATAFQLSVAVPLWKAEWIIEDIPWSVGEECIFLNILGFGVAQKEMYLACEHLHHVKSMPPWFWVFGFFFLDLDF